MGRKAENIVFSPNTNNLKCILDIKDASYRIDFTVKNSLRTVFVFNAKICQHGRYESENLVDIMGVNIILLY